MFESVRSTTLSLSSHTSPCHATERSSDSCSSRTTTRCESPICRLLLAACLGAAAPALVGDTAVEITKRTVDTVTTTLQDEQLDYAGKRKAIDAILRERVDQRILSQLVLARNWKKLNEANEPK